MDNTQFLLVIITIVCAFGHRCWMCLRSCPLTMQMAGCGSRASQSPTQTPSGMDRSSKCLWYPTPIVIQVTRHGIFNFGTKAFWGRKENIEN